MGMWHMGSWKWTVLFLLWLVMTASIADDMTDEGRERDFLRLSKRDPLRLSKKSQQDSEYVDNFDYEDQDQPDMNLRFTKRYLLHLSKMSSSPDPMSYRSLHLVKRSSPGPEGSSKWLDQPMVIRLSKRQIGRLLQIKRGTSTRDLRLSKRSGQSI